MTISRQIYCRIFLHQCVMRLYITGDKKRDGDTRMEVRPRTLTLIAAVSQKGGQVIIIAFSSQSFSRKYIFFYHLRRSFLHTLHSISFTSVPEKDAPFLKQSLNPIFSLGPQAPPSLKQYEANRCRTPRI